MADATREKIERAAKILFADNGYVATTIRQIARAASIEGGSVYYHFRGKEDILAAILEEGNRILLDAAHQVLRETSSDPRETLRDLIRCHLCVLEEDPAQFIVVTRELQRVSGSRRRKIMEQRDAYEILFRDALNAGIELGYFRSCNVKLVSYGILGALNSVTYWFDPKGPTSMDEIADEYSRLVIKGLEAGQVDPDSAAEVAL